MTFWPSCRLPGSVARTLYPNPPSLAMVMRTSLAKVASTGFGSAAAMADLRASPSFCER